MNFGLTDEHRMVRDTAHDFVRRVCPPEAAKAHDENGGYWPELFTGMAALDWFSLPFPESEGGAGAGPIEMAIITEELGRSSFDVAMCYVGNMQAAITVYKWASPEQKAELLPGIMNGTRRLAIAISEPDAGSDVSAISTRADREDGQYRVNGRKMWCTGAGLPGTTIAMYVRTSRSGGRREGLTLLLVDPASPGVTLRLIPTLARHILGTYEVELVDVSVPVPNVVGPVNEGWRVMTSNLEIERVLISSGYVGAAQATLDDALAYAKGRRQFGQPIGNFQALIHAIADLQTEIDAARLLVQRACWLASEKRPCATEASMAKLFASETYVKVARWGMQIMGGYGFATESLMSFRYRESIVATISGGTSQVHRNAIGRSLGLPVRAERGQ